MNSDSFILERKIMMKINLPIEIDGNTAEGLIEMPARCPHCGVPIEKEPITYFFIDNPEKKFDDYENGGGRGGEGTLIMTYLHNVSTCGKPFVVSCSISYTCYHGLEYGDDKDYETYPSFDVGIPNILEKISYESYNEFIKGYINEKMNMLPQAGFSYRLALEYLVRDCLLRNYDAFKKDNESKEKYEEMAKDSSKKLYEKIERINWGEVKSYCDFIRNNGNFFSHINETTDSEKKLREMRDTYRVLALMISINEKNTSSKGNSSEKILNFDNRKNMKTKKRKNGKR